MLETAAAADQERAERDGDARVTSRCSSGMEERNNSKGERGRQVIVAGASERERKKGMVTTAE